MLKHVILLFARVRAPRPFTPPRRIVIFQPARWYDEPFNTPLSRPELLEFRMYRPFGKRKSVNLGLSQAIAVLMVLTTRFTEIT